MSSGGRTCWITGERAVFKDDGGAVVGTGGPWKMWTMESGRSSCRIQFAQTPPPDASRCDLIAGSEKYPFVWRDMKVTSE